MQSELSRSQFTHDTLRRCLRSHPSSTHVAREDRSSPLLEQSTEALRTLSESYANLSTLLSNSRSLLSSLLRSQKSDTWYLETAFYVLVGTILWLIFRRLLYGPLWWLLWFPLKIFFRISVGTLTATGLIGRHLRSPSANSFTTTTLITQPSAIGAFPTSMPGVEPPTIAVGGGRKPTRSVDQRGTQTPHVPSSSRIESIAAMVDKTTHARLDEPSRHDPKPDDGLHPPSDSPKQHETKDHAEDAPRNPKKRMWEEKPEEVPTAEAESKDEL